MRFLNKGSLNFMSSVGMIMTLGYFIIHGLGVDGGKGLLSLGPINDDIATSRVELAALREQREWLQHRVSLVAEDEVDQDFLGEIARGQTGLFAADEVVIDFN